MKAKSKIQIQAGNQPMGNPPVEPSEWWHLRLSPALRRTARRFHKAFLEVLAAEEGEFPQPALVTLEVRLIFHGPVRGSRAAELIQMIGAATEGNFAADAARSRWLLQLLKSLRKEADKGKAAAVDGATKPLWDELLQRVQAAELKEEALGEPPYLKHDATAMGGIPDFKTIWRDRERYTDRLTELENEGMALRKEFCRLKPVAPGGIGVVRKLAPRHIPLDQTETEAVVSVTDFLGGPLAERVSIIGRSASRTEHFSLEPRWRDLALAYCELHCASNLLDFVLLGNGDGEECSFESKARRTMARAQGHLLKFLKAACEIDSSPALAEPVSKAQATAVEKPHVEPTSKAPEARVRMRKIKPFAETKPGPKIVKIERTQLTGSPLKILVDEVPVRSNAVPTIKVLLATCILIKKHPHDQFLKTEELKRLVLTKDELEDPSTKRIPQLRGNWKRSLQSPHGIHLEFKEHSDRFRLRNAKFHTSLSTRVIEAALTRFKSENPIQRGKRKPSS